jgi:ABC-type nitrate/sulfonate/bicarbonate transport system ATPase subunit
MEYKTQCRILRGVGGLYYVSLADAEEHASLYPETASPLAGKTILTRARGSLRTPDGGKIKVGDICEFVYTDNSFTDGGIPQDDSSGLPEGAVSAILPRRNSLIRPPLSNLDILVIVCASAAPAPATETIDKLLSVAEYHGIEAIVVIGKCELDPDVAEKLKRTYTSALYPTFTLSCYEGDGIAEFSSYIKEHLRGKVAAFAGASGVGKSTLFNLLLGLLKPTKGEIRIDHAVLDAEVQTSWLRRVGYVPQEVFIFHGTLAENIALGSKVVDRERIQNILHQVCLDKWLQTLPDGIDTVLGESGGRLSGGQKQRLGIARALYKDIDVLLLDEATSALDNATEREVNETLIELKRTYERLTILSIAHRESSLAYSDRVITLENQYE